jgi:hypothetical protein
MMRNYLMNSPTAILRCASLLLALGLAFTPLTISADGGVSASTATCMDGTCCPEEDSLCIIDGVRTFNSYDKGSAGPCGPPPEV